MRPENIHYIISFATKNIGIIRTKRANVYYTAIYYCLFNMIQSLCIPETHACAHTETDRRVSHLPVLLMSFRKGIQPPVRREDLLSDPFFPPTDEKVNRLYPRPQLGLPFPFPLTCTSDGRLL